MSIMNPSFETRLRMLHVINHVAVGLAIAYGAWWWFAAGYAMWFLIGGVGISVGFHRLLSHRSFTAPRWFRIVAISLGSLATGGTPLAWVGVHREHHRSPDSLGDPHSPLRIGFWRTYLHAWGHVKIRRRFIADLLRDDVVMFWHKHYFALIMLYAVALLIVGGFAGLLIGYCIPSVFAFHAYGLINSVGHTYGYRSYDTGDLSQNNWIVNLLTWGEGWHNNHHHKPGSWRIGEKWWEIDPGAWVISKVMLDES